MGKGVMGYLEKMANRLCAQDVRPRNYGCVKVKRVWV